MPFFQELAESIILASNLSGASAIGNLDYRSNSRPDQGGTRQRPRGWRRRDPRCRCRSGRRAGAKPIPASRPALPASRSPRSSGLASRAGVYFTDDGGHIIAAVGSPPWHIQRLQPMSVVTRIRAEPLRRTAPAERLLGLQLRRDDHGKMRWGLGENCHAFTIARNGSVSGESFRRTTVSPISRCVGVGPKLT